MANQVDSPLRQRALSSKISSTLQALAQYPLASASEIAPFLGLESPAARWRLSRLSQLGLASAARFAPAGYAPELRWFLLEPAGAYVAGDVAEWHKPYRLNYLASRLPAVAACYRAAAVVLSSPGDFFRWRPDLPLDAVAAAGDTWAALLWSGCWQDARRLTFRCEALVDRLLTADTWPAVFCFPVQDAWQQEVVRDVTDKLGISGQSLILEAGRSFADAGLAGHYSTGRSRRSLPSPAPVEGRPWGEPGDGFYRSPYYAPGVSGSAGSVFEQLEQHPGAGRAQLAALTGLPALQATYQASMLVSMGLAENFGKGWRLTREGVRLSAARDRIHANRAFRRFTSAGASRGLTRVLKHDDAVRRILSLWADAGCVTAAGWRGSEYLGRDGAIEPDGLVRFGAGGAVSGWCYLEYERWAVSGSRVDSKLRGYLAERRSNRWPLLVACRNAAAEPEYHRRWDAAGFTGVLLTTTLSEAVSGATVGRGSVWRNRWGEGVDLL